MAERSRRHEWINTCIAGGALLVAGAAAYFSWQANQLKSESLAILARSTDDCPFDMLSVAPNFPNSKVTMCWLVTLSNRSENRLSIVDYHVVEVLGDNSTEEISPYQHLETVEGKPLSLPINLDGGEGRQILVRALINVPPSVAEAITKIPEYKGDPTGLLSLRKVEEALAAADMDILGNKLPYTPPHRGMGRTNLLSMITGRGGTFNQSLTYEPFDGFH